MFIKRGMLIIGLAVTYIPLNTVFAEDSEDFVACQQIKPNGKFRPMKEKKNCFRDLARQLEEELRERTSTVSEESGVGSQERTEPTIESCGQTNSCVNPYRPPLIVPRCVGFDCGFNN
jgi:hypothetical protein